MYNMTYAKAPGLRLLTGAEIGRSWVSGSSVHLSSTSRNACVTEVMGSNDSPMQTNNSCQGPA
eukprot:43616-Eustigmatos_ZCMA.PRE.1